jgi:hypothetical protein
MSNTTHGVASADVVAAMWHADLDRWEMTVKSSADAINAPDTTATDPAPKTLRDDPMTQIPDLHPQPKARSDIAETVRRDIGNAVTQDQIAEAEKQLRHAQEQLRLTQSYPGRGPPLFDEDPEP